MAFLRFTRDKRGYEQFSLVEPTTTRRGKSRTRVLYWYRTPPNVRVGREPFDDSVRRALEAQNPNVHFDWRKIVETPTPSVETDRWRERRRAEKAARRGAVDEGRRAEPERVRDFQVGDSDTDVDDIMSEPEPETTDELAPAAPELSTVSDGEETQQQSHLESRSADTGSDARRRRRRRRGRRGRHGREGHADAQSRSPAQHESSQPQAVADAAADDTKPEPEGE